MDNYEIEDLQTDNPQDISDFFKDMFFDVGEAITEYTKKEGEVSCE